MLAFLAAPKALQEASKGREANKITGCLSPQQQEAFGWRARNYCKQQEAKALSRSRRSYL